MLNKWSSLTTVIRLIKNNKGQGIVEFALICAFCVAVGLAARDAGLLDALSDSYNSQQTVFAPSDIQPYKSNVAGNISAGTNVSGGGGTTGGEGGNTGGSSSTTGGEGGTTGGGSSTTGGEGGTTGGGSSTTDGEGDNTGGSGSTPGIVTGGGDSDEGENDGNQGTVDGSQSTSSSAFSEEAIASKILAMYENYRGKNPSGEWGDYADTSLALATEEGINIDTNTINTLVHNSTAWKTNADVAYSLKKSVDGKFDDNDQIIHDFLDTYVKTYGSTNAANNLRATNSYFANMEDWRINQMISDLGSNKLTSENVYYGYISIKQKFWSENKSVSLAINPETQSSGMLQVSSNNIYGINAIDLTKWNITTISEKNSVINKGVLLSYNNTYYIYNSEDKSNLDKFIDDFLSLGRTVQLTGSIVDHYDTVDHGSWTENKYPQLNYGDIVITENGDKYLILNGGNWYNPSNITSGNLKIN